MNTMTDYIPTAEDVDAAIKNAVNTALAFECSKLTEVEHARLKLAFLRPSEETEDLIDDVMDVMTAQLSHCLAAILNHTALEPDLRDS